MLDMFDPDFEFKNYRITSLKVTKQVIHYFIKRQ